MKLKVTNIIKYLKIWLLMTAGSFQSILASRAGIAIFLFGKVFRVILTFVFINSIFSGTKEIAGYDRTQILFFFLTFTLLISTGQMLYRELYRFRPRIISGDFDFDLVKPVHPLLRNIFGGFDLMDLITMPIFIFLLGSVITEINFTPLNLTIYFLLMINGLLIMLSIHVIVASFMMINNEVDHAIWVYRDLETLGRFPVEFYKQPLKDILTFIIPITVMFTVPAKALLGLISWQGIILSFVTGILLTFISFRFWTFSVRKYSSASS